MRIKITCSRKHHSAQHSKVHVHGDRSSFLNLEGWLEKPPVATQPEFSEKAECLQA